MSEASILQQVMTNVRQRGWHVVCTEEGSCAPPFAYTVGLFETDRQPELIVLGLPAHASAGILEDLAARVTSGERFRTGEAATTTPGRTCRFRPVAREAYAYFLEYACRYYTSTDFPVLQCVWPDEKSRYPWEDAYDPMLQWKQPLLHDGATARAVAEWGFIEPYNLGVTTTTHVLKGEPILMVTHDRDDGSWHFLSGSTAGPDQTRRISLLELVRRDPTLNEIGNLPLGGLAVRDNPKHPWQRI